MDLPDVRIAISKEFHTPQKKGVPNPLNKDFHKKIPIEGVEKADVDAVSKSATFANVTRLAIDYSDAVIKAVPKINPDVEKYLKKAGKNVLEYKNRDEYVAAYSDFYDAILAEESILVD
jgi:starch synthase